MVHKAEKRVEVDLVVLAGLHDLIDEGLQVVECLNVGDVRFCQCLTVKLPWVLLDVLGHVKQALQVPKSVVRFPLVDLSVKLALACAIDTPLIDGDLLCARVTGWLLALVVAFTKRVRELDIEVWIVTLYLPA